MKDRESFRRTSKLPENRSFHASRNRSNLYQLPVSPADREKIAHGNAERLLKV